MCSWKETHVRAVMFQKHRNYSVHQRTYHTEAVNRVYRFQLETNVEVSTTISILACTSSNAFMVFSNLLITGPTFHFLVSKHVYPILNLLWLSFSNNKNQFSLRFEHCTENSIVVRGCWKTHIFQHFFLYLIFVTAVSSHSLLISSESLCYLEWAVTAIFRRIESFSIKYSIFLAVLYSSGNLHSCFW